MKKYNEIQLTKKQMDLNNLKMENHPPSLVDLSIIINVKYCALEISFTVP